MIQKNTSYSPNFAIHPGESLRDELDFIQVSQVELAQRTGISVKHINQILAGEDPITPDTAIKLERAIGGSADFWNNLQKKFDLNIARIKSEEKLVSELNSAKKFKCCKDLVALKKIEHSNDEIVNVKNLLNFFGVNSLKYVPGLQAVAFRKSNGAFDEYSLAAWLRCGELDAREIATETYNPKKIREQIVPEVRKLTFHPVGFGDKLRELCASAGVAVVYTPYFKNTKVNGAARWIGDKAVIQLNTRGAYSDMFWFTFFHELGHILLHGIKDEFIEYSGKVYNEKEAEADQFASSSLIPDDKYAELLKVNLSRNNIESVARSVGVEKSIILGRLAHEKKVDWSKIAKLRNKLLISPN